MQLYETTSEKGRFHRHYLPCITPLRGIIDISFQYPYSQDLYILLWQSHAIKK
jgi:hypothetical protein